jgi:hypothetical protein
MVLDQPVSLKDERSRRPNQGLRRAAWRLIFPVVIEI